AARPRRCDRGPGGHRRDTARERPRSGGRDHAGDLAPHRQPGGAQDAPRRAAAADRRFPEGGAMKLRRLSTTRRDFDAKLAALTRYEAAQDARVESVVKSIIADVRRRGDAAVLGYSRRFDKVKARSVSDLEFSRKDLLSSLRGISGKERTALKQAASRI